MQPVDFTTLCAIYADFRTFWLPARLEQVIQSDRTQLALALRTLDRRGWLRLCWHPQAAHLCLS
ncbi:MAG: NFACT family protein, partial [Phormidium sp. BM_Day4_Bin.17]|nr:NFACT family protein [Phormidium sp. BM_Day4_Bin.17]